MATTIRLPDRIFATTVPKMLDQKYFEPNAVPPAREEQTEEVKNSQFDELKENISFT